MIYHLIKRDNSSLFYYSTNITGLEVIPKHLKSESIKVSKVLLIDQELIDDYVNKKINKKIQCILKEMYEFLINDEDSDDTDGTLILGEVSRLKSIVINSYKEYLSIEEYKSILKKLILAEEEFINNYNTKLYTINNKEERVRGMK
ncbi:MAG: hypothetical protein RSD00_02870 [Bacilli bacterium]